MNRDQVIGEDPASCVVLLNDTVDATVNSVVGLEPGGEAGYATFRVAKWAHDVTVGHVNVEGMSDLPDVSIPGSVAETQDFEWDGAAGAWDLVFEWRTDPGVDVAVDYVVAKTR